MVSVEFLPPTLFSVYDCHLIFTGVTRESKTVLEDLSRHVGKAVPLLDIVDKAYGALLDENFDVVLDLLNLSWEQKKLTSSLIASNSKIQALDSKLSADKRILAHKLCGAGNGGFFLCFTHKNALQDDSRLDTVKVVVSPVGIGGSLI